MNYVVLGWTPFNDPNLTYYNIYCKKTTEVDFTLKKTVTPITLNQVTVSNVPPGTTEWMVRGAALDGTETPNSNVVTVEFAEAVITDLHVIEQGTS